MGASGLERPVLAVDVVIFSLSDAQLQILLTERDREPFRGAASLPGTAVRIDESLEDAARRSLQQKAFRSQQISREVFMEQLAVFDGLYRDPRGRTVSVAFMGMVQDKPDVKEGSLWKNVKETADNSLPFDHNLILSTALQRLQGKLRYSNIAKGFLPETFRIDELETVYETILEYPVNRSNFRNKLLKIGMIEQVKVLNEAVGKKGGRPPHLYRFTGDLLEMSGRDFLGPA
ncbi:MAG: NUDIX domain-containing protein [Desulfococcaceae bacterium]|jgi:8-oxo-dGTP diphosphatase|nr:NUDIX domain-containing protein [Desulfococcaceae bacterium]